jgi:hypothetical protein
VTFASPAALWLALLAAPIIALHMLRPRRPPVEVSSTFLWREVSKPVSSATPWQRLRPNVLLALQLLAVLLLALAAARPARATGTPLARHTVFIVDTSGSMAALDGQPDRLAAAKGKAAALRRQLPTGGVASIVVAGAEPRALLSASADAAAFGHTLDRIQTEAGTPDYATTFSLAESLETPGVPAGFVFLSDGELTTDEARLLPPGTRYVKVGSRVTNRAITALRVDPGGSGLHATVTVRNTGGPAATQVLRLDVDGRTAARQSLTLTPGATVTRQVDLPSGDRVDAFLEGEDLLAADNHAFAVTARRRALRVLLAGPDDIFVQQLLAASPGVTVVRSPVATAAPGFDLVVYDGVAVPAERDGRRRGGGHGRATGGDPGQGQRRAPRRPRPVQRRHRRGAEAGRPGRRCPRRCRRDSPAHPGQPGQPTLRLLRLRPGPQQPGRPSGVAHPR